MNFEQIKQWVSSNSQHSLELQNTFLSLLQALEAKGINVQALSVGIDGGDGTEIVAQVVSSETESEINLAIDCDHGFYAYTDQLENDFSISYLYPAKQRIAVMTAHVCDVLGENEYTATITDADGEEHEETYDCVFESLKSHLNLYSPNVLSDKSLKVEDSSIFGEINLNTDGEEYVFSTHSLNNEAAILTRFLTECIYSDEKDFLTVTKFHSKQQREACEAIFG